MATYVQFGSITSADFKTKSHGAILIAEHDKKMVKFDQQVRELLKVRHHGTNATPMKCRMRKQASAWVPRSQRKPFTDVWDDYETPVCKLNASAQPNESPAVGLVHNISVQALPTRSARTKKKKYSHPTRVHLNSTQISQLVRTLLKIFRGKAMGTSVVRTRIGSSRPFAIGLHSTPAFQSLKISTSHEEGDLQRIDCKLTDDAHAFVAQVALVSWRGNVIHERKIKPGDSGAVIPKHMLLGHAYSTAPDIFIVRGRDQTLLMDAQTYLPMSICTRIRHYSVPERYWKGFEKSYLELRPSAKVHTSDENLDVERCGAVAGVVHQVLFPSCKITCKDCQKLSAERSSIEESHLVETQAYRALANLKENYPEFHGVISVLDSYQRLISSINPNREATGKIHFLIGERTEAPFSHVLRVNEVLARGNRATHHELSDASNHLLEVARYLRNRTENIKKGSLQSFRNRMSAKAHLNPSLMCDNQLDANGNFVWGKRGYHAKRFFANYFDIIQPDRGYDKYIERRHPNGVRKLAIGHLILSKNLDTLRTQLEGEPIEKQELSSACISKRHDSFIYPCCCVTHDDGVPVLSELKAPTKNHLILGNSGDPKYLDLPTDISDHLYIAKEGYCYMNIFLAMLVNIDESDAKDFTKWVRDITAEQLKQWPTISDVALACYQLSILFPAVRSAELPRILIDHKTQTMHVIDSFGSLTTGYHILKANTVSQLIAIASDSLESEMKHYRVGGRIQTDTESCEAGLKILIQSIYRPHILRKVMLNEPYLLVLSIISPTILLNLFTSGSLYEATLELLPQDTSVRMIVATLTSMATNISRVDDLHMQMQIIDDNLGKLESILSVGDRCSLSRAHAQRIVLVRMAAIEADTSLVDAGFRTLRQKSQGLMEKIYQEDIEVCWHGLTLLERLSYLRRQLRWRKRFAKELAKPSTITLKRAFLHCKSGSRVCVNSAKGCINKLANTTHAVLIKVRTNIAMCIVQAFSVFMKDITTYLHVVLVFGVLIKALRHIQKVCAEAKLNKQRAADAEHSEKFQTLERLHLLLKTKTGDNPTHDEFIAYVEQVNPKLAEYYKDQLYGVTHQAVKRESEAKLEQIVAFVALVLMIFDNERSDCVYRVLNKFKNLVGVADSSVTHQSLDDVIETFDAKETVEFELDSSEKMPHLHPSATFSQWWSNQLAINRTIPHYRSEGKFMEFTRATCASVASEIAHSSANDILLRGAVGSGKSTSLPANLCTRGRVLLIEPTKPLCQNVHAQLKGEPFHLSPSLMMRDCSAFGSSPIMIMTSGFALHFFANNASKLSEYSFILFDECHVLDANAMAFRSLLSDREYGGKIIKVSATPPGREVEFTTQFPVKIKIEESLTFDQFVEAQGSGSNADVTDYANNILVYVASYNDVDALSKKLTAQGHLVTKVDGRTMKNGASEIKTHGTEKRKHFIVATNIIENGVTLDIEAVVDFGTKVSPSVEVDTRRVSYTKGAINYGERIQRLGRVGRMKPGTALRIGHTHKGVEAIPTYIANEAAFYCFVYGLPVMTSNVSVSLLANCTVQQARTVKLFELPTYFTLDLVHHDGTMHPAIHSKLKKFKLRESEIVLNQRAIPHACVHTWMSVAEYNRCGAHLSMHPDVKIPFLIKDVPESLYETIWDDVCKHKGDASFRNLTLHSAAKIAYKLKTDVHSVQRTVTIIESLIKEEMQKKTYFDSLTATTCSTSNFSLQSISNMLRARYKKDHTSANISVLQAAKAQLLDFANIEFVEDSYYNIDETRLRDRVVHNGALDAVLHESKDGVSRALGLSGKWRGSLLARDVIIGLGVAAGGAWMLYQHAIDAMSADVQHQSKSKRQRQKLKFRDARDAKLGREVFDDNSGALEHHFGEAYSKKNKSKGKSTHGMGKKTRRFVNMYGFDPTEYSFIRFLDPITGETCDESIMADISLVQEKFDDIRREQLLDDLIEPQRVYANPGITAYFVKNKASPALRIDLTEHLPTKICDNSATIAGFPEREGILRQTGAPMIVAFDQVPQVKVTHEAKSMNRGLRDYNHITKNVCLLENKSDGHSISIHGFGYGSMIVTNRHLMKRNNGELIVRSLHGEFRAPNTANMRLFPVENRDIMIIQMPKDFPPFPTRLQFREPQHDDQVCLVGNNFQEKFVSSLVSSSSAITQVKSTNFWKHWIDTKNGHCGLPLVSVKDGCIIGLHSLTATQNDYNCFAGIPSDFSNTLNARESLEWRRGWLYNPNEIGWGSMQLKNNEPSGLFKLCKTIQELGQDLMEEQAAESGWFYEQLHCNLKAIAVSQSQLVTKHIVKGPCQLFRTYLQTEPAAKAYFEPLMGEYQKSRLNKLAYAKDALKYATIIEIGVVDTSDFELAIQDVKDHMAEVGFSVCEYVNDADSIFDSLNMKAAVGALYSGKKQEYFQNFSSEDKEEILKQSALRLTLGKMGIWNGAIKAELRPKEKVQANKTRTFTAAPIDTLLAGKMCVDDFNNQFYSLHTTAPWSVGMSKFSRGWDALLRKLPKGWVYCDADGSRFDSSLTPYLINAVLNIRLHYMEEWDIGEIMLKNLYAEIIYTPILMADGTIVKKFKGNNSGQPSTVVDNTIMVLLAMHYALRRIGLSYEAQRENCVFFANGDDLVVATSPTHVGILDSLEKSFAELGLHYNFSSRTTERDQLWFMSHQGHLIDDVYVPKLERERIVSILEWDRASEPQHRLEAICASMIEAWGYPDLLHEIRKFYAWVLEQAPYSVIAREGKAPYISEAALKKLYLNRDIPAEELDVYLQALAKEASCEPCIEFVEHQSGLVDAGKTKGNGKSGENDDDEGKTPQNPQASGVQRDTQPIGEQSGAKIPGLKYDRDVNVGTTGTFHVPRLKQISTKLVVPRVRGKQVVNLPHLLSYSPDQVRLSNTRATESQFSAWYDGVKHDYDVTDDEMHIILNGLMVWCIENGTSPNINGNWIMMDGDTQVEYPIKPLIEHAKPTFRQIMAHFSNLAEAFIEKRNTECSYMPRYGLQRNLTDMSLARFAFDFYEITSRTPTRAREAHIQMKAAALRNSSAKLFGLDGKVSTNDEDTERHTADDVSKNMHNLLGVKI